MEMGCTGVSLVTLPRDYDDTMGKEGGRRQPGQANPKQKNKKQEAEEGQEEKAEAKEGERKKKEREEESILILIFLFFFFHRGLPISYKVLESHFFMGPVEAFTKHWLGW